MRGGGGRGGGGAEGYSVQRNSNPLVAYPAVKLPVGDLVRVVGIVAPFAPRGVSILGKWFYPETRNTTRLFVGGRGGVKSPCG